ncbi:2-dehydropantoate 2-reductase (Ketopantoate reductase) (KPA reductase) (KPR) [Penicillium rubens]|nr:2-dehydropantoate 2-reductase (Ketopantoate reductase) (KPA reductase) (KPR) [Penicillium rubens]
MTSAQTTHIIGLGSIGSFVAHSLRSLPNPPSVTLLVHRSNLYEELASKGWKLGLRLGENGDLQEEGEFDAEMLGESSDSHPIYNLIVAVKASATVSALEPIRHRLGSHSTICLFQNGLGQVEDLNKRMFPDISTRPTYIFGIMRHGVYLRSSTEVVLASSNGCAALGIVGNEEFSSRPSQPQFLLDVLLKSPVLRCEKMEWPHLLREQLLKLAANCVLNPLTALLDVRNGDIKDNRDLWPLHCRLLKEISMVYGKLPELQNLPRDLAHFSVELLENVLLDTINKTARNSSSMREDIRKGRETEIEYINGWIVRRGRELGIDCVANESITQLVLAKSHQDGRDKNFQIWKAK